MATINGGGGGGGGGGTGRDGNAGGGDSKRPPDIVDLTGDDDEEEEQQQADSGKRRRLVLHLDYGGGPDLPLLPFYMAKTKWAPSKYNDPCLSVADVFAGDYHKAILSSYYYDFNWLVGEVPRLLAIPCLACYGLNEAWKYTQNTSIETFKPELPDQWGTHHSKFAILFYDEGVRFMLTTGNFIKAEWEELTEGVFVQDFPFLPPGAQDDPSEFGAELRNYLTQLDAYTNECPSRPPNAPRTGHPMLKQAIPELRRVDFSSGQAVLVASVPGKHVGASIGKYGHMRLRRLLEQEDIPQDIFLPPEGAGCQQQAFQGGTACQFTIFAAHAGNGWRVREEFEDTLARAQRPRLPSDAQRGRMKKHIVWPVLPDKERGKPNKKNKPFPQAKFLHQNEWDGHRGDITTCFNYLRSRLCQFIGGRWGPRGAGHLRTFLRYALRREPDGAGCEVMVPRLAWVLLTSSNFSKGAWGELQNGRQGGQLHIKSFELGVLFLPSRYRQFARTFSLTPDHPVLGRQSAAHQRVVDVHGFYSASRDDLSCPLPGLLPFPIPYELPAPPFAPGQSPWCWM